MSEGLNHNEPPPPDAEAQAAAGPPLAGSPVPSEPSLPSPPEFQMLDPRVINLWRVQHLITSAFLLGISLIFCVVFALNNRHLLPWIAAAWSALLVLRAFLLFWYPSRSYRARGYRIDDQVLETRRGIWFRVTTLLPLSRLQHVDLNKGPLERMFGLASLVLYTAGTQHAMVIIPGLDEDDAGRLRDHLVAVGGDDAV